MRSGEGRSGQKTVGVDKDAVPVTGQLANAISGAFGLLFVKIQILSRTVLSVGRMGGGDLGGLIVETPGNGLVE